MVSFQFFNGLGRAVPAPAAGLLRAWAGARLLPFKRFLGMIPVGSVFATLSARLPARARPKLNS